MTIGIYKIKNTLDGKVYIGSSKNIEKRVKGHKNLLKNNTHHNYHLQYAWNKYGEKFFSFEILEKTSTDILLERESFFIENFDCEYNIGSVGGGDNISKHPRNKEIRKKASNNSKFIWKNRTKEKRDSMVEAIKGENNPNWKGGKSSPLCPVCKVKIIGYYRKRCSGCHDRSGENNPFFGKTHSEETRKKLSKKSKGRKMSDSSKRLISGEKSGRFMGYYYTPWGVFPSSSQAEKAHQYLKSNTINTWCKNPDKIIKSGGKSRFLNSFEQSVAGMTYRELGFWFEPKPQQ